MIKKAFFFLLLQIYFLMILSCMEVKHLDGFDKMYFLMSNYYKDKLTLIKTDGAKIVEEKTILDLAELHGKRIIQAGFLTSSKIYAVFEGTGAKLTEELVSVRIYNIDNFIWNDVFIYKVIFDNIKIIDIDTSGGYFSGYVNKRELMYLDFSDNTISTIFKFSENVEIVSINCHYSDKYIIINTRESNKNLFHYYFIDKISYEIVNEGNGQIFLNECGVLIICENNSKIFLLDDFINQNKKNEIPIDKNKLFLRAIPANRNTFIVCLYSTSKNHVGNLLFGGEHVIENYDYRYIRITESDNFNFEYEKLFKNNNYFDDKILFDVLIN